MFLSWKKKKTHQSLGKYFLAAIALFLLTFLLINIGISPQIILLAEQTAETDFTRLVQSAVIESYSKTPYTYKSLIAITYKSDGTVSSLETNIAVCNLICSDILSSVAEALSEERVKSVFIPLGTLSGIAIFSGYGPVCEVRLLPANAVTGYLKSSFEERGINQTIHKISVSVRLKLTFILPNNQKNVEIEATVPLTETILLGKVPDAYTEIDRLTDDITETEIDDIYDFGAY